MKVYKGIRGIVPLLLSLGATWKTVLNFTPRLLYTRERKQVPVASNVRWVPKPTWKVWRARNLFFLREFEPRNIQI
jgi:hypothetical protein